MESISYLGPIIWDILTDHSKTIGHLDTFKTKIKKWKPDNYLCRSWKIYIDKVGFL